MLSPAATKSLQSSSTKWPPTALMNPTPAPAPEQMYVRSCRSTSWRPSALISWPRVPWGVLSADRRPPLRRLAALQGCQLPYALFARAQIGGARASRGIQFRHVSPRASGRRLTLCRATKGRLRGSQSLTRLRAALRKGDGTDKVVSGGNREHSEKASEDRTLV